jgi:hypothetical protein
MPLALLSDFVAGSNKILIKEPKFKNAFFKADVDREADS